MIRKTAAALAVLTALTGPLMADENTIRIGVLTDMSGPFADIVGQGAVESVRLAVSDAGGKVNNKPIEVIFADHQNKPDVALSILRQWYEERGVDVAIAKPDGVLDQPRAIAAAQVPGTEPHQRNPRAIRFDHVHVRSFRSVASLLPT